MKIKSSELLLDLKNKALEMIDTTQSFQLLNIDQLNSKPSPKKWSVLECIEHLNICGEIYLKEIENQILNAKHPSQELHKPGLIGNYSAKSMLPKKGKVSMKMKTFKFMEPSMSELSVTVIDKFIKQQNHFILLIEKAQEVNLTKTKCGLAVKGLKFKLGDAMRFYTHHNVRHVSQASRVIKN